ncbi:hypothetical protein GCM10022402_14840 [Salinactinospora qingdaonensis]|uniref:Luciferase-like monooxygenase n=1 Tax=Salinactinospora qingdaonensis TaxID=702744 RepID=A0ABP7FEK9_9ACTN
MEFESAGIPWREHAQRMDNLERSIDEIERRYADATDQPLPEATSRPRLLVGGHGDRALDIAARRADTVAVAGLTQRRGASMGTFDVADAQQTRERVEFVRQRAGERAGELELTVLVQLVEVTADREAAAAGVAATYGRKGLGSVETILDSPYTLIGTQGEIAHEILRNRDRFGVTHIVTHGAFRDALAPSISLVRELAGPTGEPADGTALN